jgi:hypothetical protein
MSGTLPSFSKKKFVDLPYLNIDADAGEQEERTIKLEDLFEYQQLTIPPPPPGAPPGAPPDPDYHILNIKKQFICVKFGTGANEKSRIYVKKPTITYSSDKLPLISIGDKTIPGEIVFNNNSVPAAKQKNDQDKEGLEIFNKVYKKLEPDERPYFADGTNAFQGGKKGDGTRKRGGSKTR